MAIFVVLAIVLVVGIVLVRWRRAKKQQTAAPPPVKNPARAQRTAQLQQHISALVADELRALDQNVGGLAGRYAMPWCLVLGEPGAGQSTLLANTGMHVPFRGAHDDVAA